jgi:hypothetical protein
MVKAVRRYKLRLRTFVLGARTSHRVFHRPKYTVKPTFQKIIRELFVMHCESVVYIVESTK